MPIAFVKTVGTAATSAAATSLSLTVPAAGVAAGNHLLISLTTHSTSALSSVTDSRGNSYAIDQTTSSGTTLTTTIASARIVTALQSGDTITANFSATRNAAMVVDEFSGLASSAWLDQKTGASGSGTAVSSGATPTTTQSEELVYGAVGVSGSYSFTPGAGFTLSSQISSTGTVRATIGEYKIVSATGAYAADGTFAASETWAACVATYKAATGGTTTKSATDSGTLSETSSTSAVVATTDNAVLTETAQVTVIVPVAATDSATLSETSSVQVVTPKTATDSGALSEAATTSNSSTRTDTASLSETRSISATSSRTDSATLTESASLTTTAAVVPTVQLPAHRLFLGIYDRPGGRLLMDLSGRAEDVEIIRDRRGPKSLTAFVPLTLGEALTVYDAAGVPHVVLTDGVVPLWSGRLEDPRLAFTARDGGLQLTALGYRRALRDLPYTALWSTTSVAEWKPTLRTEIGNRTPDKWQFDTNNRLYGALVKDTDYINGDDVGEQQFVTPAGSSRQLLGVSFEYSVVAPSGFQLRVETRNRDYTGAGGATVVTGNGTLQTGSTAINLTACDRIGINLTNLSGATYTNTAENGTYYFRVTNLRLTSQAITTPITADAILRHLHALIRADNPSQLAATTALIGSPGLDLTNEVYLDADMLEIAERLSYLGDTQSPPRRWEWGVDAEQQLYFRPRGSGGRQWYIDVGELELERTLDVLVNSVYSVYETADNERLVTATATDAASVARYGLTRRRAISAKTTSATQAGIVRDLALEDLRDPRPRARIPVSEIFDAHGQAWPLWMAAGGDTMTIRNLAPTVHPALDQIRTFGVEETAYRPETDTLTSTPDAPLPTLEWLLAREEAGQQRFVYDEVYEGWV